MPSVAIIGAGITGLTAAFELKRRRRAVTVYEAGSRPGGVIQSLRDPRGFLAESGPNTILETSPKIRQLIREAGLESRRLAPDPAADARYLARQRRPVAMPSSPLGFLTTPLFSLGAKFAVLREPFLPPRRDGVEESIGQFVTRRFNQEFLDRAVDALVGGIYAGDPHRLSLPHAFPKLKALEDNYGSMIKGQILGARDRKKSGEVAKDRAPKFSFDEGLQVLPDTLAQTLGDDLKLNTPVERIRRTADGWEVEGPGGRAEHTAVVYCGTAYRLAELQLINGEAVDLSLFREISYPAVASVVLGFRRAEVVHPCAGFGLLIPQREGLNILGTIFSSALFPNRAPEGHLTLTSYVGGARRPELAALPASQLVDLVCADLNVLFGLRGAPVFSHCTFYPRAIPQYNVGYGVYRQRLDELERQAPGLYFAGHYRDGVSLGDSIVSALNLADRLAPLA